MGFSAADIPVRGLRGGGADLDDLGRVARPGEGASRWQPDLGADRITNEWMRPVTVTFVNVGYRSTNYWVISAGTSRLLVDLGWPGTMGMMRARLARKDVPIEEIRYGLATHYHIDHAGLAEELKSDGVELLVLDVQVGSIPRMKTWVKPNDGFVDISMDDNRTISFQESRAVLKELGIDGTIIPTPGHSDDSVSVLLDDGSAFTGDLTHPELTPEEQRATVFASWRRLQESGAKHVYPGHGPDGPLDPEFIV